MLPDNPISRASAEAQGEYSAPASAPIAASVDALKDFDPSNIELIRPTLMALINAGAERFNPVRFRFIQALAEKALLQRPSVASMVEKKALRLLLDYLNAYIPAREHAAFLVASVTAEAPAAADEIGRSFERGDFKAVERLAARTASHEEEKPGALAALTRKMLERSAPNEFAAKPSFEEHFRQQESALMQSIGSAKGDGADGYEHDRQPNGPSELNAVRTFRESLRKRHTKQRVSLAIRQGPENPGPLNVQALIIRSLSLMRDLSSNYTDRFVSYVDTLLWLEKAGGKTKPAKSKKGAHRKS